MTIDELGALAVKLEKEAESMEAELAGGTREEWNALVCIREAARRLDSASIWLERAKR